jgi:hypothetical protein
MREVDSPPDRGLVDIKQIAAAVEAIAHLLALRPPTLSVSEAFFYLGSMCGRSSK